MNRDALPIASPCSADWTTMTLADRSRFCGACQKHVHELSRMTENEARALLQAPATEGLCVRYLYDARGEIVFRKTPEPFVPVTRLARKARAAVAALAALSLPVALEACTASVAPDTHAVTPSDDDGHHQVLMGAPMPYTPPPAADAGPDAH